jgi:integrase
MPPSQEQEHLQALSVLLKSQGLGAEDLLQAITALAVVKQQENNGRKEGENKIFQEKVLLFPHIEDAFIFRYGATKTKNYYLRIYCKETKQTLKQSLKTTNIHEAIIKARTIYTETYGKLTRGEKTKSLTTKELIKLYIERERMRISPLPKAGITKETFEGKKKHLSVWERYITEELKMGDTKIENILPEKTRDFKYWLERQEKHYYKRLTGFSAGYTNSIICEVGRMYRQVAVRNKYLSAALIPQIDKAKAQPTTRIKRDILEIEEWNKLTTYLRTNNYLKPEGSSPLEQIKRKIFREYMLIAYNTGMRPKELLGLRWKDIKINPTDSKENQKIFRLIEVVKSNSKTGKERSVNAPVARRFERLQEAYKEIGMTKEPGHYIFRNPTWERQNKNIPYDQSAFTRRLERVLLDAGLQEILDKTGRKITLYSSRHFYTTMRLQKGLHTHLLAIQLGTSTTYIDQTYSHIKIQQNTEQISQGMSQLKVFENN